MNLILYLLRIFSRLDWISRRIRGVTLKHLLKGIPVSFSHRFTCNFFGMKYSGNLNSYIDWCVFFFGAYEKQELLLLKDLLRKRDNPTVLDIGANVGHHSLFFPS